MNEKPQSTYFINDYPGENKVLVHIESCYHASKRLGDGWSGPFSTLEAANIAARQLNRLDPRQCFRCL